MSDYADLFRDLFRRFRLVIAATGEDPTADQILAMTTALFESEKVDAVAHRPTGDLARLDQRLAEIDALIRDLEADVEDVRSRAGQP